MISEDTNHPDWKVGDAVVIVGTPDDGMLGTILGIRAATGEYLIVFEDGRQAVFHRESLSPRY